MRRKGTFFRNSFPGDGRVLRPVARQTRRSRRFLRGRRMRLFLETQMAGRSARNNSCYPMPLLCRSTMRTIIARRGSNESSSKP